MSNNIFIDLTEEMVNKGWTVNWEFNAIDPTLFLKYNHCITVEDCATVNSEYAYDVDGNGAWNYRLDNLENAQMMFVVGEDEETKTPIGSPVLVSFNADLPKVTLGNATFAGCSNLTTFKGDLSNLSDGCAMFANCPNLESFTSDLSSSTSSAFMFGSNYETVERFVYDSFGFSEENPSEIELIIIKAMIISYLQIFGSPTSLDIASVQNIADTINDINDITPPADLDETSAAMWGRIDIGIHPSLNGNSDIEAALTTIRNKGWNVTAMDGIKPFIIPGEGLLKYNNCRAYTHCRIIDANVATDVDENGAWNYSLDNLEVGGWVDMDYEIAEAMFMIDKGNVNNDSLVSFNVNLPNLTDGPGMFCGCTGLTSFSSTLSNLRNGIGMFLGCSNLTSFSSGLPALTNGYIMFGTDTYSCTKLGLTSVQNIANTINDLTGKTSDGAEGWGQIFIGIDAALKGNADLETALATIVAKGWTVSEMYV